jgi:hypothetical protein
MLPGACLAFGVSALGIVVLPIGLLLVWLLSRRSAAVHGLGMLAGLGAIVAWFGVLNLTYRACSSTAGSGTVAPGGRGGGSSCGGIIGTQWLVLGVGMVVAAIVLYVLKTSDRPPRVGQHTPAEST